MSRVHINFQTGSTIRIPVQDDFSRSACFYLEKAYFDMARRLDAVLFEWTGRNTAEKWFADVKGNRTHMGKTIGTQKILEHGGRDQGACREI